MHPNPRGFLTLLTNFLQYCLLHGAIHWTYYFWPSCRQVSAFEFHLIVRIIADYKV
jgi:hypothetical protein